jgi:hypothetical protein
MYALVVPHVPATPKRVEHEPETPSTVLFGQRKKCFAYRPIPFGIRLVGIAGTAEVENAAATKHTRSVFIHRIVDQRTLLGWPQSFFSTISFRIR